MADEESLLSLNVLIWGLALLVPAAALTAILSALMERSGPIRLRHWAEEYGGKDFAIQTGTGYPFNKTEVWAPTLWAFQHMALHREMPQTFEQIYAKTNVFLAGWKSILENDGRPVKLAEVPEDCESPVELPNHPGDSTVGLFRKKFGK